MNKYKDHNKMADALAEWMEKSFGMTACMPTTVNVNDVTCQEIEDIMSNDENESYSITDHPSNFTLTDVIKETQKHNNENSKERKIFEMDTKKLFKSLQFHKCNAFCMRKRNIQ